MSYLRKFGEYGCYVLVIYPGLVCFSLAQSASNIREFPYPFAHVETFSSDIDMQAPWHGSAIHRVLNYDFGLNISDSLWPHGSGHGSSLFSGPETLNRTPSGIEGLPTFALLLRQWHRGDFDQFHGWSEDGVPQVKNEFDPPLALNGEGLHVEIEKLVPPINAYRDSQLRLYFEREPPDDLSIVAHDFFGSDQVFDSITVKFGRKVQKKSGDSEYIVELQSLAATAAEPNVVQFQNLSSLELVAPSCKAGCDVHLVRVERDNFSRLVALRQAKFLEQVNIRPAFYTSHGGFTLAPSFGTGKSLDILPPVLKETNVLSEGAAIANVATRHAYISDIMFRLGVIGVTPYELAFNRAYNSLPNIPFISPSENFDDFYNVRRSHFDPLVIFTSEDSFVESLGKRLPGIDMQLALKAYCGPSCPWQQGDGVGIELLAGEYLQVHRVGTQLMWYTHFGSGGSAFKPSVEEPFAPNVKFWLRRLANRNYDFDGSIGGEQRVWVPPASTWLRYLVTMEGLQKHLAVSPTGDIEINSWLDDVIHRRVPDKNAGSRDLHGVTIYVPEGFQPKVQLDGLPIKAFTRNPPDQTGRPSITLVDDNSPTVILDEVPLEMRGRVTVSAGRFSDVAKGSTPAASGTRFVSVIADESGRADVLFEPDDLRLYHSSHLHFAYRKADSESTAALRLDLIMEDGGIISAADPQNASPPLSSHWTFSDAEPSGNWQTVTFATDQLLWPKSVVSSRWARPPLPLGKVVGVHFSVVNAKPNEAIDIDDLSILRPSGDGVAPDGKLLVSGRVTDENQVPVQGVAVYYDDDDGASMSTTTDSDGIYLFSPVRKGSRLRLYSRFNGHRCQPKQGAMIEVHKNEAELDFDFSKCSKT